MNDIEFDFYKSLNLSPDQLKDYDTLYTEKCKELYELKNNIKKIIVELEEQNGNAVICGYSNKPCYDLRTIKTKLDELITDDIQFKSGEWIENEEEKHIEICYHCSKCGFVAWGKYEKTKFCGGCGTKMSNYYVSEE